MMIRLFFIRHGETDWNRQRKLQGHTDIPLNRRGQQQAQGLIPLMEQLKPNFIYSSDLARARETAEASLPGQRIQLFKDLREIHLGLAEGETREAIQTNMGQSLWEQWSDLQWPSYEARFSKGESRREGMERIFEFLRRHRPEWRDGDRVACFSHGLLLRSFAQWCANLQTPRFTTPNACVYEWRWMGLAPLTFESPPELRPQLSQIYLLPDEALSL